ncbi:MAG: protein kinase [Phaeodactylibacter sp.]|nr:protein kinase [Phaeodactylibacter sp.]MCB9273916.1 protein kinase [Lewinellaceae bacterium]
MFPVLYLAPYSNMKALQEHTNLMETLIEKNQLEQVFEELKPLVKYTEYRITVSLLLSTYNEVQQEALTKAITTEEQKARLVQVKKSLLQLLNHIRETGEGMVAKDEKQILQITLAKNEEEFQRMLEQRLAGRYSNLEKISSGDTAIIYKAERVDTLTNTPQPVAIKVIKPISIIDDENLESIREDLSKAKQLSGLDGIISVIDEGLDMPPRYIVTEYVDGMRLSERLEKGWPYQLHEIREMLLTMGRVLVQGHQDGLVHNNLWPSNILIDKRKGPRLSPFQVVRASYFKRTFERIQLFAQYWSPEQVHTDSGSQLSDQFAFGLVAFELFKGQPLFEGDTILSILGRRLAVTENPELIEEELKDTLCPAAFVQAIRKMLNHNPGERFADMEEVLEEIKKIPDTTSLMEAHPAYHMLKKLRNSYGRCRRKEGFYEVFYQVFLEKAPHAQEIFGNAWAKRSIVEKEAWRHQHNMLDLAIERLMQYPSISTDMSGRLQDLASQHAAVGVHSEDYATFLDCLKDTIWVFDQDNWANYEELEGAWDAATAESLKVMLGIR